MAMKVSDLRSFMENGRVRHLSHQDEVVALWEKGEEGVGDLLDQSSPLDFFDIDEIPEKVEEAIRTFVREVHENFEIDLSTEIPG